MNSTQFTYLTQTNQIPIYKTRTLREQISSNLMELSSFLFPINYMFFCNFSHMQLILLSLSYEFVNDYLFLGKFITNPTPEAFNFVNAFVDINTIINQTDNYSLNAKKHVVDVSKTGVINAKKEIIQKWHDQTTFAFILAILVDETISEDFLTKKPSTTFTADVKITGKTCEKLVNFKIDFSANVSLFFTNFNISAPFC